MTDSVVFKFRLNSKIRRFTAPLPNDNLFEILKKLAAEKFPEITQQSFALQWYDEQGDPILVENDGDASDSFGFMVPNNLLLYEIVNVFPVAETESFVEETGNVSVILKPTPKTEKAVQIGDTVQLCREGMWLEVQVVELYPETKTLDVKTFRHPRAICNVYEADIRIPVKKVVSVEGAEDDKSVVNMWEMGDAVEARCADGIWSPAVLTSVYHTTEKTDYRVRFDCDLDLMHYSRGPNEIRARPLPAEQTKKYKIIRTDNGPMHITIPDANPAWKVGDKVRFPHFIGYSAFTKYTETSHHYSAGVIVKFCKATNTYNIKESYGTINIPAALVVADSADNWMFIAECICLVLLVVFAGIFVVLVIAINIRAAGENSV